MKAPPATRYAVFQAVLETLEEAGIEDARRNAEWLLTAVLGCNRAQLYAYPEAPVAEADAQEIAAMGRRRAAREPIQYILGHAAFYGLVLVVTPAVLIPRPETEQVVAHALDLLQALGRPHPRILDIGTGSGCMALALKSALPEAEVQGCDVSDAALAVARCNAEVLGLNVSFHTADALSPAFARVWDKSFDLILSNPPYVPLAEAETLAPEVRVHEPPLALFADPDPLQFYKAITAHARTMLRPNGLLVFETHATFGPGVEALVNNAGFKQVMLHHDLAGLPRIITAHHP